ncbi:MULTISPECIES: hypothetical protein [unclassified Janthinobacterium]|uniref:hypothetical protein n=1 Tax=unclassified Janthinobacterium TaxID=2610881 RepID=UPI0018C98EEB|nr:hypothetical protein [Janthinobacterium sp. CG_23.4]MDH6160199.1 acidic type I keratin [Janthinobacterium sp. CG_23.4]
MSKYMIYALMVTFSVTAANWVRMFKVAGSGGNGGSSWSSRTGSGGGSYGGGSSGGSHK